MDSVIDFIEGFYEENPGEAWGLWEPKKKTTWDDLNPVCYSCSSSSSNTMKTLGSITTLSSIFVNRECGNSSVKSSLAILNSHPFYESFFFNKGKLAFQLLYMLHV